MDSLLKPVQQTVSSGADPKSVLCLFYKQGQCTKGDKCKFSHDLSLEGKSEKRSMYVDTRDDELEEGGVGNTIPYAVHIHSTTDSVGCCTMSDHVGLC